MTSDDALLAEACLWDTIITDFQRTELSGQLVVKLAAALRAALAREKELAADGERLDWLAKTFPVWGDTRAINIGGVFGNDIRGAIDAAMAEREKEK